MEMEELRAKLLNEIEIEVARTIKNLAEKYNLNEKEASNYIMKADEEKEMRKKQERKREARGRPAKEKKREEKKGARGRPPKEEKKVNNLVGEDLISRLVAEAREKQNNSI